MNNPSSNAASDGDTARETMLALLQRQREDFRRAGPPPAQLRRDRLERAIGLLLANQDALVDAMTADFGHRSAHQSLFTDVAASVGPLRHAQQHLERWMRPERRRAGPFPLNLLGARARIEFQPLGVVGVISPWNFPVNLTFAPLAGVLAAGNRCLIKPSEFTPATSALLATLFASAFDPVEVAVVTGGAQTGADFAGLPFDHLLFTGATSVGRLVMRAAAENLVPVTLELGGKSPVIVGRSADLQKTADSIMTGKLLNAGQICLAPDYVLVPDERVEEFIDAARNSVGRMYPTLLDNPDYTSIINQRHHERLRGYLDEAARAGVRTVEINPADEDFRQQPHHKLPPTLLIDPDASLAVMQDEIFGPLLPVRRYRHVDDAIGFINDRPRPLGLYHFGRDAAETAHVLAHTTSGGVTLNDVIMHVAQEDLPFGGVGPSGMGAYHGVDGFRTFSHARAVFTQSRIDVAALAGLRPPYGARMLKTIRSQMR